jgi:hypothetical protein
MRLRRMRENNGNWLNNWKIKSKWLNEKGVNIEEPF